MSSNTAQNQSQPFWRLFGFTFSITAAYILCRSVADSILLFRVGPHALPPMIFVGAVTVGVVSFLWARTTRRQRLPRVILVTQVVTILVTVTLLTLLQLYPQFPPVIAGLYLLAELRSCLSAILLALLLNHVSGKQSDKGSFAFVNAGAPLAGIIVGSFIGAEATDLSAVNLLVACVGFDVISLGFLAGSRVGAGIPISARKLRSHSEPTVIVSKPQQERRLAVASYGQLILWVVVLKSAVLTMVDYEWKIYAADHYQTSERQLTSYFGIFYAVSDGLTLILQLVLAKHFLKGVTMARSLYLLPAYLLVLGVAIVWCTRSVFGGGALLFWLVTFARGSLVLRRGLHDVVLQVLYGWLPRSSRRTTVARILGIAKPVAEAATAIGILALASWYPADIVTWVFIPALLVWILVLRNLIHCWQKIARPESTEPTATATIGSS